MASWEFSLKWGHHHRRSKGTQKSVGSEGIQKLKSLLENANPPAELTWRLPWKNPTYLGNWWKVSPLPQAKDQGESPICIPMAIHTALCAQMKILAKVHGRPDPPVLSLKHIIDIYNDQAEEFQTMSRLLNLIHRFGIVAEDQYELQANAETYRYKVHYDVGVDPTDLPGTMSIDDYVNWVKRKLLIVGPMIAEIKVTNEYTKSSNVLFDHVKEFQTSGVHEGKTGPICKSGHAITLCGWGYSREAGYKGVHVWEYLNSYGTKFGRDEGFGEIIKNHLHYVYNAVIVPWWKEDEDN